MTFRDRVARLEPRERRLLTGLLVTVAVAALAVGPVALSMMLSARRSHNQRLKEAIAEVRSGRDRLRKHAEAEALILARYQPPAPPLAGFLETESKEVKLEIPESQERTSLPHGKDFEERSNKIVLRKVDLLSLVKFMEGIEQSGYPVTISEFNVRRRGGETNSYDVNMMVSAWDHKAKPKKPEKPSDAPADASADVGGEEP